MEPPRLLKVTETVEVLVPALFHTKPWLLNVGMTQLPQPLAVDEEIALSVSNWYVAPARFSNTPAAPGFPSTIAKPPLPVCTTSPPLMNVELLLKKAVFVPTRLTI